MQITRSLYLAIIILVPTFIQTADEGLKQVATICTIINGCSMGNPIIINTIPFPYCEKIDDARIGGFCLATGLMNCFTFVVYCNYNDTHPAVSLSVATVSNVINICLMGRIIWEMHKEFLKQEQKRLRKEKKHKDKKANYKRMRQMLEKYESTVS